MWLSLVVVAVVLSGAAWRVSGFLTESSGVPSGDPAASSLPTSTILDHVKRSWSRLGELLSDISDDINWVEFTREEVLPGTLRAIVEAPRDRRRSEDLWRQGVHLGQPELPSCSGCRNPSTASAAVPATPLNARLVRTLGRPGPDSRTAPAGSKGEPRQSERTAESVPTLSAFCSRLAALRANTRYTTTMTPTLKITIS